MRMRNKAWADQYLKDHTATKNQTENPVHLEIGCGKGGFLINTAIINPDIEFYGLEMNKNALAAAVKAHNEMEDKPGNLRFIHGYAEKVREYFPQHSIERVYINFCDPWRNKAGWMRRRLTHEGFLEKYESVLTESGGVWFKTDNRNLFTFSKAEFRKRGWRLENICEDLATGGFAANITTEYERRFMARGEPIYRLEAYKK